MINSIGTANMVELARRLDIPIVYISTCGIFDGSHLFYKENDKPSPVNHYGRSKYYGEIICKTWPMHYIIRAGWGMGGGPGIDKKFIAKIYDQVMSGAKEIVAITDVYGSPTYHPDLALTISNIVARGLDYGTYNVGGERASRYEVACEFIHDLGVDDRIAVIPMTHDEYHAVYPARVPYTRCEVLDTTKICAAGVSAMRPWRSAVMEYSLLWKYFSPGPCNI
jgi:dTDP-4-dehydrorhamnose reductase